MGILSTLKSLFSSHPERGTKVRLQRRRRYAEVARVIETFQKISDGSDQQKRVMEVMKTMNLTHDEWSTIHHRAGDNPGYPHMRAFAAEMLLQLKEGAHR